ncbi:Obtusifoliol 14-alpha demethylase [Cytospora mali]|uniref:Obtusifoliol 14-alpha demethylase n=1 Tax=Cytospora mali TaxID=578113 RepID=A0A194VUA7_CYTMA|nr:Obtusifoliol 14-alpha demethylase [Valsa mali]
MGSYQPVRPITWLGFLHILAAPIFVILIVYSGSLNRPILPKRSPALWNAHHWPIIGSALLFYSRRRDMVVDGTHAFPNGTFSFFIGRKHIVNLGGLHGRRAFFESNEFSVSQGFVELLTRLVSSNDAREDHGAAYFVKCIAALSRAEKLTRRLPVLTRDVRNFCHELHAQPPSKSEVTDVTESVYFLLYRLVQRSVGATEIAENDKLMRQTLHTFERFERSTSLAHIIFPWLVTPKYLARLVAGAQLYRVVMKIINQREQTGTHEDDAIQHIYDQGGDADKVVRFIFSALSSSITMTGTSMTWLPAFLSDSPRWQSKCREEADAVISKHRTESTQSPNDILATLSLQDWESEFPVLYSCLRETLRITSTGTFFRKNASGSDIPIGNSGDVVPNNSYAAFLPDNVHMDHRLYPDPYAFNPGRYYYPGSLEGEEPHTFLGWGSGRHLCAGMRLAKLEINLVLVHMLVNFEWELSDKHGVQRIGSMPAVDRNLLRPEKSHKPIYIRYRSRDLAV